jgi:hypothetical protein
MTALVLFVFGAAFAKAPVTPSPFAKANLGPHEKIIQPTWGGVDDEETLHYDGDNTDAIGLTAGGTYTGAVRFTPTENCQLVALLFFQYQGSSDEYMFAWGPGSTTAPGAVLDSMNYTGAGDSIWKRVDFSAPIAVNGNEDFWLGPRMTHAAGVYPLGVDAGPMVVDRGGFIYFQGAWSQLADYGLDYNWNIRAIISTVSLSHDVGVMSVSPSGRIRPGDPANFEGVVKNYGTNTETFDVHYEVLDSVGGSNLFEGDTTITGLAAGATAVITIGSSTPDIGDVLITTISTALVGDENPANDVRQARAVCRRGSDPDGFGYIYESTQEGDSVIYNWIDPSAGTPITAWTGTSDDGYAICALPFTFNYYGQPLTSINICTNGFLSTGTATTYTNAALPQATIPDMIAMFWDDLNPGTGGTVYQYNSPANDYTVFAWVNVPPYSGAGTLTAQAVLDNYNGFGRVRYNYQVLPAAANSATVGIQGMTGASNYFLQYCYNGAPTNHTPAASASVVFYVPNPGVADGNRPVQGTTALRLPTPYTRNVVDLSARLGKGSAQVYDLAGNMVKAVELTGRDTQLSLEGLNAGMYFVKLDTGAGNAVQKLVLVR